MNLSFVLLTWNSEKYIPGCLESLLTDLKGTSFSYEIFIVDNGSKDKSVQLIESFEKKFPGKIFPIFLSKNTGTTISRNLALKKTKGKYIIIMDSDLMVSPGTIEILIKNLKDNKNAGMFVPRLLYPNGNLQKSTDVFPSIFTKIFRYFFLKIIEKKENRTESKNNGAYAVDYAISAMWVLKREVMDKVGLLDENIFYAPEDVDYCLRIWKSGYCIMYNPDVSCIHHTQEISRGIKINSAALNHIKGLLYYFKKHNYFL